MRKKLAWIRNWRKSIRTDKVQHDQLEVKRYAYQNIFWKIFNAFLARILPKHAGIQQYITNHGRVFKSKGLKESNTCL